MRRLTPMLILAVLAGLLLTGCTQENDTAQNERAARNAGYARLAAKQPPHTMGYSPSRDTINFWIDTWGKTPGKLSYVYLLASNGQMIGYYVFRGLPVSYCAALTPTYDLVRRESTIVSVPAAGVDGVYYSGGQCSAYYGRDASTNSYLEYTIGQGISALIYERPLPRQDIEPLGFSVIGKVKK